MENNKKVFKEVIKYGMSSVVSFAVDYSFFTLFSLFLNVTFSNIFARVISASVNYTINKKIVFKSDNKVSSSLSQYVLLASVVLLLNTCLLNLLVRIGINKYIAKIMVEVCLSVMSFIVQKTIIFKKKKQS